MTVPRIDFKSAFEALLSQAHMSKVELARAIGVHDDTPSAWGCDAPQYAIAYLVLKIRCERAENMVVGLAQLVPKADQSITGPSKVNISVPPGKPVGSRDGAGLDMTKIIGTKDIGGQ